MKEPNADTPPSFVVLFVLEFVDSDILRDGNTMWGIASIFTMLPCPSSPPPPSTAIPTNPRDNVAVVASSTKCDIVVAGMDTALVIRAASACLTYKVVSGGETNKGVMAPQYIDIDSSPSVQRRQHIHNLCGDPTTPCRSLSLLMLMWSLLERLTCHGLSMMTREWKPPSHQSHHH